MKHSNLTTSNLRPVIELFQHRGVHKQWHKFKLRDIFEPTAADAIVELVDLNLGHLTTFDANGRYIIYFKDAHWYVMEMPKTAEAFHDVIDNLKADAIEFVRVKGFGRWGDLSLTHTDFMMRELVMELERNGINAVDAEFWKLKLELPYVRDHHGTKIVDYGALYRAHVAFGDVDYETAEMMLKSLFDNGTVKSILSALWPNGN